MSTARWIPITRPIADALGLDGRRGPAVEAVESATRAEFRTFRASQTAFEGRAEVRALATGIGGVDSSTVRAVVFYEAMLMSDQVILETVGGVQEEIRQGAGVRIRMEVTDLAANVQANAYSLSVAAEAGLASSMYELDVYGLPADVPLMQKLPGPGFLNRKTYTELLSLVEEVQRILGESQDLRPTNVHVRVGGVGGDTLLDDAQAIVFAMHRIRSRDSLLTALATGAAAGLSGGQIRATYRRVLGDWSDDAEPDVTAKRAAARWLSGDPLG